MPTKPHREHKLNRLRKPGHAESYLKASFKEALMDGNYPAFYLALRDVIEARELNKTALAEEAEIARQHLHFILTGEGNPTFSSVISIIKALGFSFILVEENDNIAA